MVVDDDPDICELLTTYLSGEGLDVSIARNGTDMRSILHGRTVDLILLDLGLPGEDGLQLLRELRHGSNVPIIVLTGKGDAVDRIVGLEIGADDYVTKPFHLRELLARIRTVLRRSAGIAEKPAEEPEPAGRRPPRLAFEGWTLDPGARTLRAPDGTAVDLTTMEFNLLTALVQHPNQVLTREQLLDACTGRELGPMDRSIDVHIGNIRRKIEDDPKTPRRIKTIRGVGYVFVPDVTRLQ
jgi:two-component system OmpR family response regulator